MGFGGKKGTIRGKSELPRATATQFSPPITQPSIPSMPRTKTVTSTKKKKGTARRQPSSSAAAAVAAAAQNDHSKKKQQQQEHTAKDFFEAAEHAMTCEDANRAIALYDTALSVPIDKANMDATLLLEKRAEAKVSISDPDGARADFQRAFEMFREDQQRQSRSNANIATITDPVTLERMASLLMYIGQLSGGIEALESYKEGIQLLEQSLAIQKEEQQQQQQLIEETAVQEVRKQLAAACSSAAELYLTDLCYEDNAEQECEAMVHRALECNTKSLDALQTAASLRLSQCRGIEAVTYIQQCFAQIQAPCEALSRLVGIRQQSQRDQEQQHDEAMELTEEEAAEQAALPGFEFRCQTAKLLLECATVLKEENGEVEHANDQKKQQQQNHDCTAGQEGQPSSPLSLVGCTEAAVTVLGSLLAEDDTVIELWYLTGDAFATLDDAEMARYYYEKTAEMLQHVQQEMQEEQQQGLVAEDEVEEEMLQQRLDEVECQLEDVQQKLRDLIVPMDVSNKDINTGGHGGGTGITIGVDGEAMDQEP